MTTCLYCNNKHSKEELEAKDAEIAALSANNKEMGIERFELINEIARLRRALERCVVQYGFCNCNACFICSARRIVDESPL